MSGESKCVVLTDSNFEQKVIQCEIPVLVFFWASWSGSSYFMTPIIEALAAEYEERAKIGKLDIDKNPETETKYAVHSLPTSLFFENGRIVGRMNGTVSKEEIVERLNALL